MKWYLWVLVMTSDGSTFFETEYSGIENCQKAQVMTLQKMEQKYSNLILVATDCKTHPRPQKSKTPSLST